jgi:hypothetical protein
MVEVEPGSPPASSVRVSSADGSSRWKRAVHCPFTQYFVVLAVCIGLWALATPMFSSPDEPAHMVRAYAVVHGDFAGETAPGSSQTKFLVPAVLVPRPPCFPFDGSEKTYQSPCDVEEFDIPCYSFKSEVTADCLNIVDSGPSALIPSRTANYPPLGHLLAGWPSLLSSGLRSLYLMRLANGLAAVALIALAFDTASRSRSAGALRIALVLSLTPLVLWISGTVNPSGPAIGAAAAAWVGGYSMISDDTGLKARSALARWGAPFCIFMLLRRDSLLWGALMIVVMMSIISERRLRELVKQREFWAWSGAILASAGLQLAFWGGDSAGGFASTAGTGGHATRAFQDTFKNVQEMIGVLGWLDSPIPDLVYFVWLGLVLTMTAIALGAGASRLRIAIALVLFLTVGAITGLGALRYGYLQGRYVLPFSMGLPLMSAITIAARRDLAAFLEVLRKCLIWLLPLLQTLAFAQLLRRYSVGDNGPYSFFWNSKWAPPYVPISVLCVLHAVASSLMYRMLLQADDRDGHLDDVPFAVSVASS